MSKPDGYLTNPLYREVASILTNAGIEHTVELGGRHWFVLFRINGHEYRQVLHLGPNMKGSTYQKTIKRFRKIAQMRVNEAPLLPLASVETPSVAVESVAPTLDSALVSGPVVALRNGVPMADSRDVAAAFGKRHADVLRDIGKIECSAEFTERNFALSEYKDTTGRSLPHFFLTRDGFAFLCMGFTGQRAAAFKEAYIAKFNEMEAELRAATVAHEDLRGPVFGSIKVGQAARRDIAEVSGKIDRLMALAERLASAPPETVRFSVALDQVGVPREHRRRVVANLWKSALKYFLARRHWIAPLDDAEGAPWMLQADKVGEWWAAVGREAYQSTLAKGRSNLVVMTSTKQTEHA